MGHLDKIYLLITLILGKTLNVDSSVWLRVGKNLLLSLWVLKCLQLKVIHTPKWHILRGAYPEPLHISKRKKENKMDAEYCLIAAMSTIYPRKAELNEKN